ncbi:putative Clathrin assembly protein [Melia azedarach]|uniref:Clathrin assembly protein n=1 Tax=Melia azedarach TaxID=155640 RepID=A0ACC1XF86_MELAZ|nr:putative Clathrin assembly protein [Melia azedarach]
MYALYLQEQVECFHLMRYDIEKSGNKTKILSTQDLLDQLPSLQQLLYRLLDCKPEGVALSNSLIRYALSIVASESVKLYVSVTDGILNLVDKFFEMPSHDALRTLEIYRKAENQIDGNPPALPIEGPKIVACSEADLSTDKQNPDVKEDSDQLTTHESARSHQREAVATQQVIDQTDHAAMQQITEQRDVAATDQITDLLGLEEITQQPSELDENNSLALAIAAPVPENPPHSGNNLNTASQAMDWELALVTAPSS